MRKRRPRILYLAPAWPHEKSFGKQLRLLHVGRALRELGEVDLVVACNSGDAEAIEKTTREFRVYCSVNTLALPHRGLSHRLNWWLNPRSLGLFACVAEEPGRSRVREGLANFDLIWLNSIRLANMFGLWRWPRSILDIDDVPSSYQLTEWRNGARLMDRLKAGARALALRRGEKLLRDRFTLLGVCSEADRRYLGGGSSIHVIPNGFERPRTEPDRQPGNPPRLGFIGLFSYPPNAEGVRWFLRESWPLIKREVPGVRLRLVGKDSDGILNGAGPEVDSLGWVKDPSEEIATWSAMIVPIRVGAGTRVKIAEAFSRKVPLVSTRLGALGYDVADGRELLLADTPEAFARACIQVIREPTEAAAMAQRAWESFLNKWTWDAVAPRVWAAAEHCLQLNTSIK
jgi:glycosyltransferase involved in cell wall biosynthesis